MWVTTYWRGMRKPTPLATIPSQPRWRTAIRTTPEHPFYAMATAPPALSLVEGWLAAGERQGRWTPAGDLKGGDHIQQADGTTGVVQAVVFEAIDQVMYNLTVADAHTFFVGDGTWLVHNSCSSFFLDGVTLTHVFEGEIKASGRAVGFHYAGGSPLGGYLNSLGDSNTACSIP